jgi:hypothetical protein
MNKYAFELGIDDFLKLANKKTPISHYLLAGGAGLGVGGLTGYALRKGSYKNQEAYLDEVDTKLKRRRKALEKKSSLKLYLL